MPKKYQPNYSKKNYSHSARSSRAPTASSSSSTPSPTNVNELLNQLRRQQNPKVSAERRDEVALVASQRTVPPTLRSILNLPETEPIVPIRGLRQRPVRGRQVPGPAAPPSWLQSSRHARVKTARERKAEEGGVDVQAGFKHLVKPPARNSLVHHALRQIAADWEWHAIYEANNLCTLPASLKTWLISYIALYSPEGALSLSGLKTVFHTDGELEGGTGGDGIETLDLSGLIGKLTVSELTKYIADPLPDQTEQVEDSWEEVEEARLTANPSLLRFPHLTRLSLAHPLADAASWSHLLHLSRHLNTLTHLSLAYWPTPTLTPNSKTVRVQSRFGRTVQYGGTDLYAALDDDYYEPANILRRFSLNTYSLRWLDLEGCIWVKALIWESSPLSNMPRWREDGLTGARSRGAGGESPRLPDHLGPDWNGAWGQIEYLRLVQRGTGGARALEVDKDVRWVADTVRALRSERKGKFCHVDIGEGRK